MKKRAYTLLILPVVAIVLEALPYGAVLNFADDSQTYRETFSYFSLTPYGYANFGPLIAAVLTCVALLLVIILLAKKEEKLCMGIAVLSGMAAAASLMGNVMGFSVVGLLITLVLLGQCVLSWFLRDRLW